MKTVNEEPMIFELKCSEDGEMGLWLDEKKLRYVGDFNLSSSAAMETAELEIKLLVRLWAN